MKFLKLALISSLVMAVFSSFPQVTRIVKRDNPLLSRKKRYLMFPPNSNFVITLSAVKALLQVQPRGFNILGECDVPFALPRDTRIFKKRRRNHYLQRREILSKFQNTFDRNELNGTACVKRMICEATRYSIYREKSIVTDVLSAIFMTDPGLEEFYGNACHNSNVMTCEYPFLDYILKSLFPE